MEAGSTGSGPNPSESSKPSVVGASTAPAKPKRTVRRIVMALIPPVYAVLYAAAMLGVWYWSGLAVNADIWTLCLIPLALVVVLSLPSLVGLAGRIGPFALSWGLTVAASLLVLVMMAMADGALEVCCITFLFLPLVLVIVVVSTLVSGAWAALAAVFGGGGPRWTAALLAAWLLLAAGVFVGLGAGLIRDVGWVKDGIWLLGCCWLLLAVGGSALLAGLHLLLSRRKRVSPAE